MSFRPPNKKPSGSRPLRTASVDSTASEKSPITTIPEESRKAPEPAALPLGDVDEVTEDSVPFYADGITPHLFPRSFNHLRFSVFRVTEEPVVIRK